MLSVFVNKQSSIRISGEKTVYFDPWDLPEGSPKADAVFVTHDHFDHYSAADIKKVLTEQTAVVVPEKMAKAVKDALGSDADRVLAVKPGQTLTVCGIPVETAAAYNKLKPFHPKSAGWCGYAVTLDTEVCYVTGDTDAVKEGLAVKCDRLFVPIGGTYTMNVDEAAAFAAKLAPRIVVPTHYGTVVGSPSDGERFRKKLEQAAPSVSVELIL